MKRKVVLLLLLSLFANGAMSQVGIYRSSNYGAIKKVKKIRHYEWNRIALLNYGYNYGLDQHYVGVTYAKCKLGGFYGSMAVSPQWTIVDVKDDWHGFFLTNNSAHSSFSVTGGGLIRLVIPVYAYLGTGYIYRSDYQQIIDSRWIKMDGNHGLKFEIGAMASIKSFTMQFGGEMDLMYSDAWFGFKAGMGYSFGEKKKKEEILEQ